MSETYCPYHEMFPTYVKDEQLVLCKSCRKELYGEEVIEEEQIEKEFEEELLQEELIDEETTKDEEEIEEIA